MSKFNYNVAHIAICIDEDSEPVCRYANLKSYNHFRGKDSLLSKESFFRVVKNLFINYKVDTLMVWAGCFCKLKKGGVFQYYSFSEIETTRFHNKGVREYLVKEFRDNGLELIINDDRSSDFVRKIDIGTKALDDI